MHAVGYRGEGGWVDVHACVGITRWGADVLCADANQRKEKRNKGKKTLTLMCDGCVRACGCVACRRRLVEAKRKRKKNLQTKGGGHSMWTQMGGR